MLVEDRVRLVHMVEAADAAFDFVAGPKLQTSTPTAC